MRRFFVSLHLYYKTRFYTKKKPFGNLSKEQSALVEIYSTFSACFDSFCIYLFHLNIRHFSSVGGVSSIVSLPPDGTTNKEIVTFVQFQQPSLFQGYLNLYACTETF
jgi:hypothetical protein